ncbi:MAG: SLC13 family permease [Thermoproteota archaeon]|nr:SLC13 family permease [Thermoproteota archaeon]MDQ4066822.1 SLC13 family permease [Thermoproteota archaeon]
MINRQQAKKIGLILGPILFLVVLFSPVAQDLPWEARIVLASTFWMGSWWITEAIPIYVTALLPVIIFPSLNVTDLGETSANYADRIVFLFLGGFILAKAVEKSNLHRRFALNMLKIFGTNPKYIVASFMMVTGFLSGWMSNTATTMLMLPIAAAVISQFQNRQDKDKFGLCLMLSVAYSASIGGMSTLIGTPPNAILASLSSSLADVEVTFGEWLLVGLPISAISLVVAWLYMVNIGVNIRGIKPVAEEKGMIGKKLSELGRITGDEILVAGVFAATATAWITRGLLWQDLLPLVDDSTIAIAAAISLFLIPSISYNRNRYKKDNQDDIEHTRDKKRRRREGGDSTPNHKKANEDNDNNRKQDLTQINGESEIGEIRNDDNGSKRLMDWKMAVTIPWGVILLIGGGLALANAYTETGLDEWIAERLVFLQGINYLLVIFVIVAVAIFVGEIVSNTASAALLIPISASLAVSLGMDPLLLMIPLTIATSFGFVMPVGTPPNAIVFASGYVTIPKMARAGLPLDIIGIVLVTILTTLLVPLIWS